MSIETLDGIWQFGFCDGYSDDPLSIRTDDVAAVPGCFDASERFTRRGTGVYRRSVRCGGKVRLSFSGGLRIQVYLDGRLVGSSQLPYTLEHYEFDAGEEGVHDLVIVTDNMVEGNDAEIFQPFYDFYLYGGIYSHVELEPLRDDTIRRIQVTPLDITTGLVEIALEFAGQVSAALVSIQFDDGAVASLTYTGPVRLNVPGFKLWSPDSPSLHTVTVTCGADTKTATFGIRTLEWHGGVLKLNGKPIRLLGYCRHEAHPDFGAATPASVIRNDLVKIKQQGCNFIRGSHYPQREEMLEVCDRIGLLVWDEALGWGNKIEQLTHPQFQERQVEQTVKMIRNSYNHPSVIMWGFLNECQSTDVAARDIIGKLVQAIHENDTSRPSVFASDKASRDVCLDFLDVIAFNCYPGWYDADYVNFNTIGNIRTRLDKEAAFASEGPLADKPLILSEIGAAAMIGDHSGARWSEEYQAELIRETLAVTFGNPRWTGIAIWQYSNCRTYITTSGTFSRPRGFNNKGLLDEYRRQKLAWYAVTEFAKSFKAFE